MDWADNRSSTTHPTWAQTLTAVFFFWSWAPAARNNSNRGAWQRESNLVSICCQEASRRSGMKNDSKMWSQWTTLLSGSNHYNDRNGKSRLFPLLESSEGEDLTMQRMGELRVLEYKSYLLISIRKERKSLSGGSVSFGFKGISHRDGPMTSEMNFVTHHRNLLTSYQPKSIWWHRSLMSIKIIHNYYPEEAGLSLTISRKNSHSHTVESIKCFTCFSQLSYQLYEFLRITVKV